MQKKLVILSFLIKFIARNQTHILMRHFCIRTLLLSVLVFLFAGRLELHAQICGPNTPSFVVTLTAAANATFTSSNTTRNDTCCGGVIAGNCVKFVITLHQNAMGINFGFASGAIPPGALFYQINCGPIETVGTPICLNGPGPHTLTFCKPGGNANTYSIVSIPKPDVPDSIMVRDGCSQVISVTGFSVPTITWGAINGGSNTILFNSYLSCTSGCSLTNVTPTGTVPVAFVDYTVGGFGQAPCISSYYSDTVRVYFYSNLTAPLTNTTICFGSTSAVLSPTPSGGKPSYTYTWSTGSNNSSITVGAGNYTLTLGDQTGCPPITSTVTVGNFTVPITANPGPNQTLCVTSPTASIAGSVTGVTTGSWSGGSGNFVPSNTVLNISYNPTPLEVSTGSVQLFLQTTNNLGCTPGTGSVTIFFQPGPTVTAIADRTVCANNNVTTLSSTIATFPATPLWTSANGGTFSAVNILAPTYTPGAAAIAAGSVNVIVTTTNNGVCAASSDTVTIFITPKPIVNAGSNQTICSISSANLNGTVIAGATTGSWSSSGSGIFSPSSVVLNPSYAPSAAEITAGSATLFLTSTNNGNCLSVKDTVVIFITKQATVNAGPNLNVCSSTGSVPLTGTVLGTAGTATWSVNGSGGFSQPVNSLTNTYNFTTADVTAGFVIFTLTSTNNGPCPAVSDSVRVNFQTLSIVNAGLSQTVCSSQGTVNLQGSILTPPGTGSWTSNGSGGFITPVTSITPQYTLSSGDMNSGSINFTLTSTNNGACPPVSNTVNVKVIKQATVNAGPNLNVCSASGSVPITGTVLGTAGTGTWSVNGSGGFAQPINTLVNTYNFSTADVTAGFVIFTLTSTNNGPCAAVSDSVRVNIQTLSILNAGTSQTVCSSQNTVILQGTIFTPPQTGSWTTNGSGGFITPIISMAPQYTLSSGDINLGSVNFTLTSTNNGACPPVSSTVNVKVVKEATVNAGVNQNLCSSAGTIALSGTVTGGTNAGTWSTNGGGGIFNANSPATTYTMAPSDPALGLLTFTYTSQNNGPCPAITDTVRIRIVTLASVNAGTYVPICSTQSLINLTGAITGVNGLGTWTTSGTGSIQNPGALNTTYSLSVGDIQIGLVNFTLSSINNGPCPVVKSTASLQIVKIATVQAGVNQSICSDVNQISLSGTVSGVSGSGLWTSDGSGSYNPANTILNPVYNVTPQDKQNGSVTFTLTSSNNGPCPAEYDSVRVKITTLAVVNAGLNQVICSSQKTLALFGNVNGAGFTGTWTATGSGSFTPSNANINPVYTIAQDDITAGFATFTLTSVGNGACPAVSDSVRTRIQNQATVNAGPDFTICSTTPAVNLNGVIGGVTNTGVWGTSGTGTLSPASSGLSALYTVSQADIKFGWVYFGLTSTNNGVCPAVPDSLSLRIITYPTVKVNVDTTICDNKKPFRVVANVSGGSGAFLWSTTGSGTFVPNNVINPTNYLFGAGDVALQSINITYNSINNGPCGNVSASTKIEILPTPVAAFTPSQYTLTIPQDKVTMINETKGGKSYKWTFGDGGTSNLFSPVYLYKQVGFYTVTLVATNEFGCRDTASRELTVISEIIFPTAFTPNPSGPNGGKYVPGDMSNDVFFPFTGGLTEYKLLIFNRWGELIFTSHELETGWDGYFNGKMCQQDVYVWKAEGKFFDGRDFKQVGTVTLLR